MKSFLAYLGGKSLLTGKILPKIPEHTCYVEVFAGAAWILFKKEESPVEIINDINTDLCTLYRVVKHHLEEFIRQLKWVIIARDEYLRFLIETPESLTDIQRAVRFYYLLRCGYGGKVYKQTFNINTTRPAGLNLLRLEEELSAVHLRLSRVYIENKPYQQVLERYDKPHTFFYLDPPYYGFEDYYGKGLFGPGDFEALGAILESRSGKFIMSINDVPEIRRIFNAFRIEPVRTTYMVAGGDKKVKAGELLISNY